MDAISKHGPLIAIVGETASGKTAAGIHLAKILEGEIICADSRTIYRGLDIGTAKPSVDEQQGIAHHLLDICDPTERYSAAAFSRDAQRIIREIRSRGHVPIVVGGTGLYVYGLLYNYRFSEVTEPAVYQKLERLSVDELTTLMTEQGIKHRSMESKNKRHMIRVLARGTASPGRDALAPGTIIVGLKTSRDELRSRITQRVEMMFDDGYELEAKKLFAKYDSEFESMSGIGYRVMRQYIAGEISKESAIELFVRGDMSLAKRQRTWFGKNKDIKWFDSQDALVKYAVEFVHGFDYNGAYV